MAQHGSLFVVWGKRQALNGVQQCVVNGYDCSDHVLGNHTEGTTDPDRAEVLLEELITQIKRTSDTSKAISRLSFYSYPASLLIYLIYIEAISYWDVSYLVLSLSWAPCLTELDGEPPPRQPSVQDRPRSSDISWNHTKVNDRDHFF